MSSNGLVTAVTTGVATIQATVASRFDTASVTVQSVAPTVAVVAVALDSTSLTVGHGAKASAVAKDAAGNVITGQAVTWTSLSPAIATVSSTGAVMAVAPGSATIKGTISGISGSASITVVQVAPSPVVTVAVAIDSSTLAVGHSAQASATPKDAAGNTVVGQTVTWASLTPSRGNRFVLRRRDGGSCRICCDSGDSLGSGGIYLDRRRGSTLSGKS